MRTGGLGVGRFEGLGEAWREGGEGEERGRGGGGRVEAGLVGARCWAVGGVRWSLAVGWMKMETVFIGESLA